MRNELEAIIERLQAAQGLVNLAEMYEDQPEHLVHIEWCTKEAINDAKVLLDEIAHEYEQAESPKLGV